MAVPGLLACTNEFLGTAKVQVLVDAKVASQSCQSGGLHICVILHDEEPVVVGPKVCVEVAQGL